MENPRQAPYLLILCGVMTAPPSFPLTGLERRQATDRTDGTNIMKLWGAFVCILFLASPCVARAPATAATESSASLRFFVQDFYNWYGTNPGTNPEVSGTLFWCPKGRGLAQSGVSSAKSSDAVHGQDGGIVQIVEPET